MRRYSPGVYTIANRHTGGVDTWLEYHLDNQTYQLFQDRMITLVVKNNLMISEDYTIGTSVQVTKQSTDNQIIGNVSVNEA